MDAIIAKKVVVNAAGLFSPLYDQRRMVVPVFYIILVFMVGCASTTRVTSVENVKHAGKGGIVYALPKTVLDIEVPITKEITERADSECAKYTEKLFGKKPITESAHKFSVGVPTITPVGVPDYGKVYYAQIEAGIMTDSALSFTLDSRGVIGASAVETENKTSDFAVSTVETVAKIVGSVAKFASAGGTQDFSENEAIVKTDAPAVYRVYRRIQDAYSQKDRILCSMGSEMQVRLDEVNKSLEEDVALFFGRVRKETWSVKFRIEPDTTPCYTVSLLAYHKQRGIVKFSVVPCNRIQAGFADNLGESSSAGMSSDSSSGAAQIKEINVVIESKPLVAPATASNVLFSKKEKGLRYNIPALGTVTVWQSGEAPERLLNVQLPFGQLGSVGFLPVSTGSKKLRQEIALDPTTGALLSVKNVTSAFDPQSINKTGAASANILDAYKP